MQAVKNSFARSGFATQVDSLESRTRELQARFSGKEAATPSAAWRMLHEAEPELVLSMLVNGKGVVQQRLKTFLNDSPTARQRIPYATLQEMRITPDLPDYNDLLDKLFFELMDGKLTTPEEMKAFLEPYSPPAPPPPLNLRRARVKKEARPSRAKGKKAAAAAAESSESVEQQEEALGVAEGLMEPGTLTGPDRGTEPSVETPLEGKVAPLAPGETEPSPKKPARPSKAPKVLPEADSEAARKLSAKPAPVATKQEKAATTPHPQAAREIAAKRPVVIPAPTPAKVAETGKAVSVKAAASAKTAAVPAKSEKAVPPARKATKVTAAPAKRAQVAKNVGQKRSAPPAKKVANAAKTAAKASAKKPAASSRAASKLPVKQAAKASTKVVKASAKGTPAKSSAAKKAPAKALTKKTTVKTPAKKAAKAAKRR